LHTNALDEVLALPSERAAEIALSTQQVIAEETGVTNVVDPLGGSWYVEDLTDRLEAAQRRTSPVSAISGRRHDDDRHPPRHRGWLVQAEIAGGGVQYNQKLEKGRKKVVGVNVHTSTVEEPLEILRVSHEVERAQRATLADRRSGRISPPSTQR